MKDPVGYFFAVVFAVVALAVFFFGKDLKFRVFLILGLCSLSVVVLVRERISELAVSYKEFRVKLVQVETKLDRISKAMETLVIAQRVERIEDDNSILLDYEPIPQSVRITVGPLVHYPRPNYGYRLEGRKIYMLAQQTIDRIRKRMQTGGVTVEYLRKVEFEEAQEESQQADRTRLR